MFFERLEQLSQRPAPFSMYTAEDLWTDPHTSARMLEFHLDDDVALASRSGLVIEQTVRWLTELVPLDRGARVLDLGCGPGLYANRLGQTGAEVVGVDFSERSIRHAERTAPPDAAPTYLLGNYLEVDVAGEFDLVLLAMYDYCALAPPQRQHLLRRITSWLRPTGRFVFDVYGVPSLRERTESITYAPNLMDGFWSATPYHGFLHTFVYEDERVVLDRYEIVEPDRNRTVYNWLQYFDEAALVEELDGCGLVVERLLGDLTGAPVESNPREFAVVARPA